MTDRRALLRGAGLLPALALLAGCQTAYFRALETFGIEKRNVLVNRVEDARDAQTDAKEQFASALDRYRAVVGFDGGDLEELYDRLSADYERSADRARAVTARIDAVEDVGDALFEEWEDELGEYRSASLRRESQQLMATTRARYAEVLAAMRRAERSMMPVLETFQDQVLVLKHNLNARAVGALRTELASIERDTAAVIAEMERAIAEADEFIAAMSA